MSEPKPVQFTHKGWEIKKVEAGFSNPDHDTYFVATKKGEEPITSPTYVSIIGHINLREWKNEKNHRCTDCGKETDLAMMHIDSEGVRSTIPICESCYRVRVAAKGGKQ